MQSAELLQRATDTELKQKWVSIQLYLWNLGKFNNGFDKYTPVRTVRCICWHSQQKKLFVSFPNIQKTSFCNLSKYSILRGRKFLEFMSIHTRPYNISSPASQQQLKILIIILRCLPSHKHICWICLHTKSQFQGQLLAKLRRSNCCHTCRWMLLPGSPLWTHPSASGVQTTWT